MGWVLERLAWCALAGALLATLGSAAWQSYQLLSAGPALDTVAPLTMALEVMRLDVAAGQGALVGIACGLAVRIWYHHGADLDRQVSDDAVQLTSARTASAISPSV